VIPIRDINPSQRTPVVCYAIILSCLLAFFYELLLGRHLESFLFHYGLVPLRYTEPQIAARFSLTEQILPFFTSMFLHGGWLHLIGNMWTLYIFGDNVEAELGHSRFLLFYLVSGLVAAVIHLLTNLSSPLPTIGASGAVAGVMGAYFILYPGARILAVIPIFIIFYPIEVPAFVFLGSGSSSSSSAVRLLSSGVRKSMVEWPGGRTLVDSSAEFTCCRCSCVVARYPGGGSIRSTGIGCGEKGYHLPLGQAVVKTVKSLVFHPQPEEQHRQVVAQ